MPPRYAYWTIIVENLPTAFRARLREELLPTFERLRQKHPDAVMKWFSRGQLWESPEAASQAAALAREERRGKDWRPGGTHRDPRDRFKDQRKRRKSERDRDAGHVAPVDARRSRDEPARARPPDRRSRDGKRDHDVQRPGERSGSREQNRPDWRGKRPPHSASPPPRVGGPAGSRGSRPAASGASSRTATKPGGSERFRRPGNRDGRSGFKPQADHSSWRQRDGRGSSGRRERDDAPRRERQPGHERPAGDAPWKPEPPPPGPPPGPDRPPKPGQEPPSEPTRTEEIVIPRVPPERGRRVDGPGGTRLVKPGRKR